MNKGRLFILFSRCRQTFLNAILHVNPKQVAFDEIAAVWKMENVPSRLFHTHLLSERPPYSRCRVFIFRANRCPPMPEDTCSLPRVLRHGDGVYPAVRPYEDHEYCGTRNNFATGQLQPTVRVVDGLDM